MNISLPPELSRFIEKKIKAGIYTSSGDVIVHALRNLQERDRVFAGSDGYSLSTLVTDNNKFFDNKKSVDDITALVFIVMMQAAKDLENDLKMIMAEMKATTEAKKKLRELISKVSKDISANSSVNNKKTSLKFSKDGIGGIKEYRRLQIPVQDTERIGMVKIVSIDILETNVVQVDQIMSIKEELYNRLDSMSEISEMTSLRLHMAMDRRAKFLSTLSNIIKKMSSTAESIVQNIR